MTIAIAGRGSTYPPELVDGFARLGSMVDELVLVDAGDGGGGHDLADHTLRAAARGEDGRGCPTTLSRAVAAHVKLPSVEWTPHRWRAPRIDVCR